MRVRNYIYLTRYARLPLINPKPSTRLYTIMPQIVDCDSIRAIFENHRIPLRKNPIRTLKLEVLFSCAFRLKKTTKAQMKTVTDRCTFKYVLTYSSNTYILHDVFQQFHSCSDSQLIVIEDTNYIKIRTETYGNSAI